MTQQGSNEFCLVSGDYDKENVSPFRGTGMKMNQSNAKRGSRDKLDRSGDSPGKRMAERWLSERRSETVLRPTRKAARNELRAESALG